MKNPFSQWMGGWGRKKPSATTRPDVPPTPEELHAIRPEEYVGHDTAAQEELVREKFVDKARQTLGRLPMARQIVALYFCMLDGKTPMWVKGVVTAALAYFIMPMDAIPDILPLFGLTDDVTILTAALSAVAAYITADHYRKADEFMNVESITPTAPPPGSRPRA